MAKRITIDDVLAEIKDEEYLFPRGEVATICVLTLQNGRQVVGAVFGQDYDRGIGKQQARNKAIGEIWPLLVFRAHSAAGGHAHA